MTEQTAVQKALDTNRVINHLSRNFRAASGRLDRGTKAKDDKIKQYQIEFAYMVDEIQRGPSYLAPKVIADANELIAKIMLETQVK